MHARGSMAKRRSWITKPPLLPIVSLHHLQMNLDKQITAPILQCKSHRNVRKYEASWQAVTDISLTSKLPMFRNCICNRLSSKPLNGITVSCLSWLEVLGVAFGSCSIALDKKAPQALEAPDCQKKRLMDARKMLLYFTKFLEQELSRESPYDM